MVRFSVRTVLVVIGLVIAAWALLSILCDHPAGDLLGADLDLPRARAEPGGRLVQRTARSGAAAAAVTYIVALAR